MKNYNSVPVATWPHPGNLLRKQPSAVNAIRRSLPAHTYTDARRFPSAHPAGAADQIVIEPPLLCIEVLSPEDTMRKTRQRVRDFLSMGVLEVWIVDPAARSISVCTGSTMVENSAGALTVPGTPVVLELAEVFQVLDES